MSEIDLNKIMSDALSKQIDDNVSRVTNKFATAWRGTKAKATALFLAGYGEYVKRTYARCAQVKTILYRHRPVPLRSHYVEPHLKSGNAKATEQDLVSLIGKSARIVLIGTAGLGKSFLIKNLLLRSVESDIEKVPVFFELRNLNGEGGPTSLVDAIFNSIAGVFPDAGKDVFLKSLKHGNFAFFLDGFDEIDYKQARRYEKELLQMARAYPGNSYIVTSRPDQIFSAWEEFSIYTVQRMTKSQIIDLIKKIEYDPLVKEKFAHRIEAGLYEKHREFLSNPLLATIMLLTFEQIADIPEKIHVFYQLAFETLFNRHDTMKELYTRERYVKISIDEFKRVLGAFCLISYLRQQFSFSEAQAHAIAAEAIELEGDNCSKADNVNFINDLLMSVCFLQRDGNELRFAHRSFQEYFCAFYVCLCDPENMPKILDEIVSRAVLDSTLTLVRDMNSDIVDKYWTSSRLTKILSAIDGLAAGSTAREYHSLFSDLVIVHPVLEFVMLKPKGKQGSNKQLIFMVYHKAEFFSWFGLPGATRDELKRRFESLKSTRHLCLKVIRSPIASLT